jgi:F0F1-type ATP synthase assembly protein I
MRYRGPGRSPWPLLVTLLIGIVVVVAIAYYLNVIPH